MVGSDTPVRLTAWSQGAGCGCKIAPHLLTDALARIPLSNHPDLLVGREHSDDAAVYRIDGNRALVSTADFFTPIVDDPYDFGRIAAANALSDVYAMGGEPLVALNLVAYSLEQLGPGPLERILRGGQDVVETAGAVIGGGHSIEDAEPKYGLAVTGIVDPGLMLTNSGGRAGDALVLTKPVGAGLATTAAKRGIASTELIDNAVAVMTLLNAEASHAAVEAGANASTDITGFGLLGHAHELALASGLAAEITARAVPTIEGTLELAELPDCVCGGTKRNAIHLSAFTEFHAQVAEPWRVMLADAMTSGGLLVAIDEARAAELDGTVIGRLSSGRPGQIHVR